MANPRGVDDIVNNLLKKAGTSSIRDLLAEAANAGAEIGKTRAAADIAKKLPELLLRGGIVDDVVINDVTAKRSKIAKGVVQCPYPKCENPGIRPLNCFCQHHYDTLDQKKREELRKKQIDAKAKAKKEEAERIRREQQQQKKAAGA